MIFIGFLLISSIFFVFAHFAGGVQFFLNLDSLCISPLAAAIFSIFTFRTGAFVRGIRSMFALSPRNREVDRETADLYLALIFISLAAGVCSTFQGMISGILYGKNLPSDAQIPLSEMFCYASFSSVYGLMYAAFLFYPVYLFNGRRNRA